MDIKTNIKLKLREQYGEFLTQLEHQYEEKIIDVLIFGDTEQRQAWMTYNQVILEFKNNLKDMLRVKELQYKLTDNSNPNSVCIEVIEGIQEKNPELERLYNKIRNF